MTVVEDDEGLTDQYLPASAGYTLLVYQFGTAGRVDRSLIVAWQIGVTRSAIPISFGNQYPDDFNAVRAGILCPDGTIFDAHGQWWQDYDDWHKTVCRWEAGR